MPGILTGRMILERRVYCGQAIASVYVCGPVDDNECPGLAERACRQMMGRRGNTWESEGGRKGLSLW